MFLNVFIVGWASESRATNGARYGRSVCLTTCMSCSTYRDKGNRCSLSVPSDERGNLRNWIANAPIIQTLFREAHMRSTSGGVGKIRSYSRWKLSCYES